MTVNPGLRRRPRLPAFCQPHFAAFFVLSLCSTPPQIQSSLSAPSGQKARDRPTQGRSHNRATEAQTHLVVHILNTDKYHISLMGSDGPLLSLFPDLGLWREQLHSFASFPTKPTFFFPEFQKKSSMFSFLLFIASC